MDESDSRLRSASKKRKLKDDGNSSSTFKSKKESIYIVSELPKSYSHMKTYTNNDINGTLKKYMSDEGYRLFKQTCFGIYTEMPCYHVQGQLFKCFLSKELKTSSRDALMIRVNGSDLRFSLREFAIISGLNCFAEKKDFVFDNDLPNRIIDKYFGGGDTVIKAQLIDAFNNKVWNEKLEDELKLSILYFIHAFILTQEPKSSTIHRLHFDLVDSGRYAAYPWGIEAFNELAKTMNGKMSRPKQYYRIQGMPYAMQVWFYECCLSVYPKIAIKVANKIPRLLNWEVKKVEPYFKYLMKHMFSEKKKPLVKYKNIQPFS